jgi:hypothetical protein
MERDHDVDNIMKDHGEIRFSEMQWICLDLERGQWRALVFSVHVRIIPWFMFPGM